MNAPSTAQVRRLKHPKEILVSFISEFLRKPNSQVPLLIRPIVDKKLEEMTPQEAEEIAEGLIELANRLDEECQW